ncbi:MAG: hypothetical protein KGY50_03970 [Candidatus Thermoplasmatota archaeon]|nr:hypothetical protein [Candidatus Thermoplasmatota archaeon]
MGTTEKDWNHIKKQIKKSIQQHQTEKPPSSKTLSPSWQEIEKHIRKKHTHSHKKSTHPNEKVLKTKHQEKQNSHIIKQKKTTDQKNTSESNVIPKKTTKSETKESSQKTHQKKQRKHFLKTTKKQKKKPVLKRKNHHFKKSFQKKQYPHKQATHTIYRIIRKAISFDFLINKKRLFTLNPKKLIVDNIVELLLIIFGIIFIFTLTQANIKIGLTLILIASFLLLLMTDEAKKTEYQPTQLNFLPKKQTHSHPASYYLKKHNTKTLPLQKQINSIIRKIKTTFQKDQIKRMLTLRNIHLTLNDRITITLISWTLLLFLITADIEIFFVLIFLGILITKEMTDVYTNKTFKTKLNVYIITFLFIYGILISQKIITIIQT